MESVIVRKLCQLHVRQLKNTCQSWRQLTSLSKHLALSRSACYRNYCSKFCKHGAEGQSKRQSPLTSLSKHLASSRSAFYRNYCSKSCKHGAEGQSKSPDTDELKEKPFISPIKKPKEKDYIQKLKEMRRKNEENASKGPSILIIAATAVGFLALYAYLKQKLRQYELSAVKNTVGSTQDEVLVGGDWELTNQDGKRMTNKDFVGQWCLVYFGFTHCPDICPDEIEKITEVMDILDRNPMLPKLRALFITVDPDRDSPEAMKTYLAEFSDKIVGLTGNWDELKKILKAFKVYYSQGPIDEDGDYIVDHSIITYLMNPDGKYEAHFARSKTNVEVANIVQSKMKTWNFK